MNKRFNFITLCLAFLCYSITSCNKEPKNMIDDNGMPAEMKLSLLFSKQGTRATSDSNAKDLETEIKTVDVIVYNTITGTQVITSLDADDFTTTDEGTNVDNYIGVTNIQTTTGTKNIYVAINRPESVNIKDLTEAQLATSIFNISSELVANTTTGFVIFSVEPVTKKITAGEANKVEVTVSRLASKVTIRKHASDFGITFGGFLKDIDFITGNVNQKGFLLPDVSQKDPNYTESQYIATDYVTENSDAFVAINENTASIGERNTKYITENTSDYKKKKALTHVIVRMQYVPANSYSWDGTNLTPTANTAGTAASTFYSVLTNEGNIYFSNVTEANDYIAAKGLNVDVKVYTDGYAYYHIWLNQAGIWNIIRNTYFDCTIKKIFALGNPGYVLDSEEGEEVPSSTDKIEVAINILHWTPITEEIDLEP